MPNVVAGMSACLGIVIGSLGPWATFPTLTTSAVAAGTEGDGRLTLVLAAVGAALFAILSRGGHTKYGDRWGAPTAGVLAVLIGIIDAMKISDGEVEVMKTMVDVPIGVPVVPPQLVDVGARRRPDGPSRRGIDTARLLLGG